MKRDEEADRKARIADAVEKLQQAAAEKQAAQEDERALVGAAALAELLESYTLLVQPKDAYAARFERDYAFHDREYLARYALASLQKEGANTLVRVVTTNSKGEDRTAWVLPVKLWLAHPRRKSTRLVVFEPKPETELPEGTLNLFRGFPEFEDGPGSCDPLIDHVHGVLCRGDDLLAKVWLDFHAHMLQCPWEKPGIVLIVRGKEGAGKSAAARHFGRLTGPHYLPLNSSALITARFNSHLQNTIYLHGDEVFFAGDPKADNVLKSIITDEYLPIEAKFRDIIVIRNYLRIVATTNAERPLIVGLDARRPVIFHASEAHLNDEPYFGRINRELESGGYAKLRRMMFERAVDIRDLRFAPRTQELAHQKLETALHRDPVTAVIHRALQDGEFPPRAHNGMQLGSPTRWSEPIARDRLEEIVHSHCARFGVHDRPSVSAIGRKLRDLLGTGNVGTARDGATARRAWRLPPLDEARALFAARLGADADTLEWQATLDEKARVSGGAQDGEKPPMVARGHKTARAGRRTGG